MKFISFSCTTCIKVEQRISLHYLLIDTADTLLEKYMFSIKDVQHYQSFGFSASGSGISFFSSSNHPSGLTASVSTIFSGSFSSLNKPTYQWNTFQRQLDEGQRNLNTYIRISIYMKNYYGIIFLHYLPILWFLCIWIWNPEKWKRNLLQNGH